jgi:hypothetical protein
VEKQYSGFYEPLCFAANRSLSSQPALSPKMNTNSLHCLQGSGKATFFVLLTTFGTNFDALSTYRNISIR